MLDTTTVHWHDARDEKPKSLGNVLLAIQWNGMVSRTCCAGRWAHDTWWVDILGTEEELGDANTVTHWAYLPDVPSVFDSDTIFEVSITI